MPCQFLQVPPGERVRSSGKLAACRVGHKLGGSIDRRSQLLPDHGIDLPKLVVQLGPEDAQRHGMPDGSLFNSGLPALDWVGCPDDQSGKFVSTGGGDGERLQLPRDGADPWGQ